MTIIIKKLTQKVFQVHENKCLTLKIVPRFTILEQYRAFARVTKKINIEPYRISWILERG